MAELLSLVAVHFGGSAGAEGLHRVVTGVRRVEVEEARTVDVDRRRTWGLFRWGAAARIPGNSPVPTHTCRRPGRYSLSVTVAMVDMMVDVEDAHFMGMILRCF
jgi:hypothetical protein